MAMFSILIHKRSCRVLFAPVRQRRQVSGLSRNREACRVKNGSYHIFNKERDVFQKVTLYVITVTLQCFSLRLFS
jgi:hypothetical protein